MTLLAAALRPLATFLAILLAWRLLVALDAAPSFLLPAPEDVLTALRVDWPLFERAIAETAAVALIGYRLGSWFGALNALLLARYAGARRWLLPLIVGGQAVPVLALGPLLSLWLGFDMAPKIVMTALVVYFPVTASFYDGLARVDPRLIDLARVAGASPGAELWRLRVPAALPELASGLRMAAVFAPISAIIGEMTGAAGGLGGLMRQASGRLEEERLFAALLLLAAFGVAFHAAVRFWTRRALPWAPEAPVPSDEGD